ncbi:hypothetical protein CKW46_24035 [Mycobacterium liflandii]|nr:hypothetical protein CKW46_24035 [Mycobacterium liflandii]
MTSALESSIHMTLSVEVAIKESLSHDSENRGNSYRWVGCRCRSARQPLWAGPTVCRNSGAWPAVEKHREANVSLPVASPGVSRFVRISVCPRRGEPSGRRAS